MDLRWLDRCLNGCLFDWLVDLLRLVLLSRKCVWLVNTDTSVYLFLYVVFCFVFCFEELVLFCEELDGLMKSRFPINCKGI